MLGWNRGCRLGVPLIVHLNLDGTRPFLVCGSRCWSNFRDLMFILPYYLLSLLRTPPVIFDQGFVGFCFFFFFFFFFDYLLGLDCRFFFGRVIWMHLR